jgi:hypothetical protein
VKFTGFFVVMDILEKDVVNMWRIRESVTLNTIMALLCTENVKLVVPNGRGNRHQKIKECCVSDVKFPVGEMGVNILKEDLQRV